LNISVADLPDIILVINLWNGILEKDPRRKDRILLSPQHFFRALKALQLKAL